MGRRERRVPAEGSPARMLGATVRRVRQAHGIALSAMAQRLSYTKGYLSAVETGAVWPSREFLEGYERAMDLRPGELTQMADNLAPTRRQPGGAAPQSAEVGELLARIRQGIGPVAPVPASDEGHEHRAPTARHGQAVVRGFEAAVQWAAALVQDAAGEPAPPGEGILISAPTWTDALGRRPDLAGRWRRALCGALDRGWDVVHLCRLDQDTARHFSLIAEMLDLLGLAGHYEPYSLPSSISSVVPCDLLIVPGKGALQFLTTGREPSVDAACFYPDGEPLAVLRDHVEGLRSRAISILKTYMREVQSGHNPRPHPDLLRYAFALTRVETPPGDRLLVKDGLRSLALPDSVFLEWARRLVRIRGDEWTDWMRILVENRLQRVATFHDQLRVWRFRDICSKRAVERLLTAEKHPPADWRFRIHRAPGDGTYVDADALQVPVTLEERVKQVQGIVNLLKTYPNYELGLLDDAQATELVGVGWEVKGKYGEGTIFLDTWDTDGEGRVEMSLEIALPDVVEAFRAYFQCLWDSLPVPNVEKRQVIAWLEAQVERVPSADPN